MIKWLCKLFTKDAPRENHRFMAGPCTPKGCLYCNYDYKQCCEQQ